MGHSVDRRTVVQLRVARAGTTAAEQVGIKTTPAPDQRAVLAALELFGERAERTPPQIQETYDGTVYPH